MHFILLACHCASAYVIWHHTVVTCAVVPLKQLCYLEQVKPLRDDNDLSCKAQTGRKIRSLKNYWDWKQSAWRLRREDYVGTLSL